MINSALDVNFFKMVFSIFLYITFALVGVLGAKYIYYLSGDSNLPLFYQVSSSAILAFAIFIIFVIIFRKKILIEFFDLVKGNFKF